MWRRLLSTAVVTVALVLPLAGMASAENTAQPAARPYDWRSVLTQSVKVQMKINSEFEFSKKRRVPIHFTMGLPFSKDTLITRTRFPEQQGNLAEIQFLSPDKMLMEYITISVGTVGGDTAEERLKRLFAVIDRQVYPSLTPPSTAKILGGRKTTIAGHPAIEFVSLFEDPKLGSVAARIVGVIAPNNTDVVFLVQRTMRDKMNLSGPDELAKTFGGTILSSLTFQGYRDASGAFVAF